MVFSSDSVLLTVILPWVFVCGFLFLIGVAGWAVIEISRMRREQAVAMAILHAVEARIGLKKAIDQIQTELGQGEFDGDRRSPSVSGVPGIGPTAGSKK